MKRLIIILIILTAICLPMTVIAEALPQDTPDTKKALLYDEAELLKKGEAQELDARLEEISEKYSVKVIIATTEDTGNKSASQYADDLFDYNDYGANGIVLLVDMGYRNYWISTSGSCISAFTDEKISDIGDKITPYLSEGEYYNTFNTFVDEADLTLKNYKEELGQNRIFFIIAMVLLALFITFIVVKILASQMKTIRRQTGAKSYEKGLNLTRQTDVYLYSTVRTEKIESSNSGGSSTHTSSSGSSHGGGGGSF